MFYFTYKINLIKLILNKQKVCLQAISNLLQKKVTTTLMELVETLI
jgi:hypothetical protein